MGKLSPETRQRILERAEPGALSEAMEWVQRNIDRPIGLGIGAAGLLADPIVGRPPKFTEEPDPIKSFQAFQEGMRRGGLQDAISATQDTFGAPPGYWGAAEALGTAFVPTGVPFAAGKGLVSAAPKIAGALTRAVPRARPAVETGISGLGRGMQMPWRAEEAIGRGAVGLAGRAFREFAPEGVQRAVGRLGQRFARTEPALEDTLPGEGQFEPRWWGEPASPLFPEPFDIRPVYKGPQPGVTNLTRRSQQEALGMIEREGRGPLGSPDPPTAVREARMGKPIATGKQALLDRLDFETRVKGFSPTVADTAREFLEMLPEEYLDDLGSSYVQRIQGAAKRLDTGMENVTVGRYHWGGTDAGRAVAGRREPAIITIARRAVNEGEYEGTIIHELVHHLEDFVSAADVRTLRNQWRRAMNDEGLQLMQEVELLRVRKAAEKLAKKEKPLTSAEIAKISRVYRFEGGFNEWFAEVLTDKALRDIYMEIPVYRNILQKVLAHIKTLAEGMRKFIARVLGRGDEAERVYQRLIKGDYSVDQRRSWRLREEPDEAYDLAREARLLPLSAEEAVELSVEQLDARIRTSEQMLAGFSRSPQLLGSPADIEASIARNQTTINIARAEKASRADPTTAPVTGARVARPDLTEKMTLSGATDKETSLLKYSELDSVNVVAGKQVNRYWAHEPPAHKDFGQLGPTQEGGIQAYALDPTKNTEAAGVTGKFKAGLEQKVIWMDEGINPSEHLTRHYIIDATKLPLENVSRENSGLVHGGDIPPSAIVKRPDDLGGWVDPTPTTAPRATGEVVEGIGEARLSRRIVREEPPLYDDAGYEPPPPDGPLAGETPPQGDIRLGKLRKLTDIIPEIATVGSRLMRWLASTGINPSAAITDAIGKGYVAHQRLVQSAKEMTTRAISFLDRYAERGTGRMPSGLSIDPDTKILEGTGQTWDKVFASPEKYNLSAETRAYIDDFHRAVEEMNQMRREAGFAEIPLRDKDGNLYVPKLDEKGNLRPPRDPNLDLVEAETIEGWAGGANLDASPRDVLKVYLDAGYKEIIDDELAQYLSQNSQNIRTIQLVKETTPGIWERREAARLAYKEGKRVLGNFQRRKVPPKKADARRLREDIDKQERRVEALKNRYDMDNKSYREAVQGAKKATTAPGELFGRAEGPIPVQVWRNRLYPKEQAESLARGEAWLQAERGQKPWITEKLINAMRAGAAIGDFAMPFHQGLFLLARHPMGWVKMTAKHYEAFFDPTVQMKVLTDPKNREALEFMEKYNVPLGDVEFYTALQRGEGVSIDDLPFHVGEKLGKEKRRALQEMGRQSFGRFQASYNTGLLLARIEIFKALRPTWADNELAGLAQHMRNMTGGLDSRALGVGPARRRVEAMFLAFSPRLLRSTAAVTADAVNQLVRISTGRGSTAEGKEALRSLATLLGGIHAAYILSGLALGKPWEEIQRGLNPLEGGKYLSHEINGDWIGIGGQVRAMIQVMTHLASAAAPGQDPLAKAAGIEPSLGSLAEGGIWNNPLVRAYYYRGAPGTGVGLAVGEYLTDADVKPFVEIDSLPDLGLHIGKSSLPFAVQGLLEGEQALTFATSLGGARTSVTRPESAVRDFTLTLDGEESSYFDLVEHPAVIQSIKLGLPPELHDEVDEYLDADYDKRDELIRTQAFRDVREAFRASTRPGGKLYELRGRFLGQAPLAWKVTMASLGEGFAGSDKLKTYLLEYAETAGKIPDIDYIQWVFK